MNDDNQKTEAADAAEIKPEAEEEKAKEEVKVEAAK